MFWQWLSCDEWAPAACFRFLAPLAPSPPPPFPVPLLQSQGEPTHLAQQRPRRCVHLHNSNRRRGSALNALARPHVMSMPATGVLSPTVFAHDVRGAGPYAATCALKGHLNLTSQRDNILAPFLLWLLLRLCPALEPLPPQHSHHNPPASAARIMANSNSRQTTNTLQPSYNGTPVSLKCSCISCSGTWMRPSYSRGCWLLAGDELERPLHRESRGVWGMCEDASGGVLSGRGIYEPYALTAQTLQQ